MKKEVKKMIEATILLIMCITRMIFLSVPALFIIIIGHALIYQFFGISIYKNINKIMMKGVK